MEEKKRQYKPIVPHSTRPPKFDYTGEAFLKALEDMAAKGYTDRDISFGLIEKFGAKLKPAYFNELKNEKGEDGTPTERGMLITEALARGRAKINLLVRDTYLKMALGRKKVKTVVTRYLQVPCECKGENPECPLCGGIGKKPVKDKPVIEESESELAPNHQALATWLFNHDKEWRDTTIAGKRLDITSGGNQIGGSIEIVDKTDSVQ